MHVYMGVINCSTNATGSPVMESYGNDDATGYLGDENVSTKGMYETEVDTDGVTQTWKDEQSETNTPVSTNVTTPTSTSSGTSLSSPAATVGERTINVTFSASSTATKHQSS